MFLQLFCNYMHLIEKKKNSKQKVVAFIYLSFCIIMYGIIMSKKIL